jgi:hypothetical protein
MYCEDSLGTDIDHHWPRTPYPLRTFEWLNHVLACAGCNRRKSVRFPLDGAGNAILIDPTLDDPREHLAYSPSQGRFVDTTARGAESIEVYDLNRGSLVDGRRDAWRVLQLLIVGYAGLRARGEEAEAEELRGVVSRYSFSSVLVEILNVAANPDTRSWLEPECADAIEQHPEINDWVV